MLTDIEKVEIRRAMQTLIPPFFVDQQQIWGCIIPLLDEMEELHKEVDSLNDRLIEETLLTNTWIKKHDELLSKVQSHPEWLAQLLVESWMECPV